MNRALSEEAAFCFQCNNTTAHLVLRRNGEITKMMCRTCKTQSTGDTTAV